MAFLYFHNPPVSYKGYKTQKEEMKMKMKGLSISTFEIQSLWGKDAQTQNKEFIVGFSQRHDAPIFKQVALELAKIFKLENIIISLKDDTNETVSLFSKGIEIKLDDHRDFSKWDSYLSLLESDVRSVFIQMEGTSPPEINVVDCFNRAMICEINLKKILGEKK